jgi:hypothetical protein
LGTDKASSILTARPRSAFPKLIASGGEQKRAICRSISLALKEIPVLKDTGAFEFVKDLVLEVPRFPLTCRGALAPDFQPCGQGSYYEAHVIDAFV